MILRKKSLTMKNIATLLIISIGFLFPRQTNRLAVCITLPCALLYYRRAKNIVFSSLGSESCFYCIQSLRYRLVVGAACAGLPCLAMPWLLALPTFSLALLHVSKVQIASTFLLLSFTCDQVVIRRRKLWRIASPISVIFFLFPLSLWHCENLSDNIIPFLASFNNISLLFESHKSWLLDSGFCLSNCYILSLLVCWLFC